MGRNFTGLLKLMKEARIVKYSVCEDAVTLIGGYQITERDPRFSGLGRRVTTLNDGEGGYAEREISFPDASNLVKFLSPEEQSQ